MGSEFDQRELVGIFVAEAIEGAKVLGEALHPSGDRIPIPTEIREQYIVAHRLRGAAALYEYEGIARLAERLESLLEGAIMIPFAQWPRAVQSMRETVHIIERLVHSIDQGVAGGQADTDLVERCLQKSADFLPDATEATKPTSQLTLASVDYLQPPIDTETLSYFLPEAQEYLDAIEGLVQSLRVNLGDRDAGHRLFRAAHTLKGSAYTVGCQVIGDLAHPIEDCMLAVHEGNRALTQEDLNVFAQAASVIRALLRRDQAEFPRLQAEVPSVLAVLQTTASSAQARPLVPEGPAEEASSTAQDTGQSRMGEVGHSQKAPSEIRDEYLVPSIDQDVMAYFLPEAQEYLESLESNLLRLEKEPQDRELINQLFRAAHTLKGSAYTVGFQSLGDLVHQIENFMGSVRDNRLQVLPGHTDQMLQAVDVVRALMERDMSVVTATRSRFRESLAALTRLEQGDIAATAEASESSRMLVSSQQGEGPALGRTVSKIHEAGPVEEREVVRVSYARLERLMNLVGELVIGRGRLEQRLRSLEQLSQQVQMCEARLINSVQSFEEKYSFTYQTAPGQSSERSAPGVPELSDFGSLELDKYDDFNILSRRISEVTADIRESMAQLNGSLRLAHDDMGQLQQLTLGMRDEIARTRMVPIGTPFTRFRRAIRDIARACNKEVALMTSGEHTEVDTGVVERLVDPLIHLVRNAVYHGIESPAERVSKGKSEVGTVYLHAAHRGNSVIVEVEDDGAGLDYERIRGKAVTLGLLGAEQAKSLSNEEVLKFIFSPGFSTADKVGEQAGRGVGLDAVNQAIEGMNGHIDVESIPGIGTKFTLVFPLTLMIAGALLMRTGNERYAIPLAGIREVILPTVSSFQQVGERTLIQVGEEAIEVHPLRSLLRRQRSSVDPAMPVVIVKTPAGPLGLAVDELLGRHEIVIKRLGSLKPLEESQFGGATVDPEGRVILVLDPSRLMTRRGGFLPGEGTAPVASGDSSYRTGPGSDRNQATILLVDDSLSIRKFVGRMLEIAGYQFDTAIDGEDGLRKASVGNYQLIITDLEMPKLNGFEVVQALRSRPQTKQTPVVVMTTRSGDKHRQLAMNMGANSHIAKPVDEQTLINEVRRWVGQASAVRTP